MTLMEPLAECTDPQDDPARTRGGDRAGAAAGPPRPPWRVSGDAPVRPGRPSRREQIIDGAAEVFAEYGYHGSSLRHIATHVGITHPGMLHHFDSKHDLLGAVIDRMEAHAQKALDRVDELSTTRESLLLSLSEVWDPCSASIQLLATLDADVVSRDHPGRYRVARLHRVHEHVLQECFLRLDRAGLLRPDIDPAFMARSTLALVLNHAMREKTVRMMQGTTHDDAPLTDVTTLVAMFLKDDPADASSAE